MINIAVFWIFSNSLHLDYRIANSLAWVLSVLFAYFANKLIVFRSRTKNINESAQEMLFFFGFRLLSYGLDLTIMILLISGLNVDGTIAKTLTNLFVMAANYAFSKAVVFRESTEEGNG